MIQIKLIEATDYQREHYGILYVSETTHRVTGTGVHNQGMRHRVTVWRNKPSSDGGFIGPDGKPTPHMLTTTLDAQASVISRERIAQPSVGETLCPGDIVNLCYPGTTGDGFPYQVTSCFLRDPELIPYVGE